MANDEIEDVFIIPEESFTTERFTQDGLPGHAAVNSALVDYERKKLFGWHFSILVEAENIRDNGMPTAEEQQVLVDFEEKIEPIIKAKGNALTLAGVTHNGNRELIYRVRDPEPVNDYMQSIVKSKDHPRYFEYRIDPDENWEKAKWYLEAASRS